MGTEAVGHTEGPWKWHWGGIDSADLGILAESGQMVAMVVVDEDDPQEQPEQEANARLIASAPDLLAACKAACADLGIRPDFAPIGTLGFAKQMLDAIARAEGGAA